MYGLVQIAIQDLVCEQFGEGAWQRITEKAGVPGIRFVSMDPYDDALCYQLVAAAADELDTPAEQLLEVFGEYWTKYTAEHGYGELLASAGTSFEEFLQQLDELHFRLARSFPELKPPSFDCVTLEKDHYQLHYYSEREGLGPMVVGLVRGLASRFGLDAEIVPIEAIGDAKASLDIRCTAQSIEGS